MLAPGVRSTWSPRATKASKSFWRNTWAGRVGAAVASARAAATVILTATLFSQRDSQHHVSAGVECEFLITTEETAVAHIGRVANREVEVAGSTEQGLHEAGREIEQRVPAGGDVEGGEAGLPRGSFDLDARVGAVGPPAPAGAVQLGAERRARRRYERQRLVGGPIGAAHGVRARAQREWGGDFDFDGRLAAQQAGISLLVAIHAQRAWRGSRYRHERVRRRDVDEPVDRVVVSRELDPDARALPAHADVHVRPRLRFEAGVSDLVARLAQVWSVGEQLE